MTLILVMFYERFPPSRDTVPHISVYFSNLTALLCFIVIESIIVHRISGKTTVPGKSAVSCATVAAKAVCKSIDDNGTSWETIARVYDRLAAICTVSTFIFCSLGLAVNIANSRT